MTPSGLKIGQFVAGTGQMGTDPSLLPAASDLPSGLNATAPTRSGVGSAASSRPSSATHSRTTLIDPHLAGVESHFSFPEGRS